MCLKLCKTTKIKLKDGKIITLRRPKTTDLKQLKVYINSLVDEDAQILINERMTLKDEEKWLKGTLSDIRKGTKHFLVADYKKEIIGAVHLKRAKWRQSHVADVGVSVKRKYRRLGLASIMLKRILDIGRRDKNIKVIWLSVYSTNKIAKNLYKKFGFRKVATVKRRIQYKNRLVDEIVMDYKG